MGLFSRKRKVAPEPSVPVEVPAGPRRISLALQGGGALGAFQWGVLERLLEDERIEIAAVTAASAGAMNAVALIDGLIRGGREGAREGLDRFWRGVNSAGGRNVFGDLGVWTAAFNPRLLRGNPFYRAYETMLMSLSPYEFNPFDLNPLRDVLTSRIDFAAIRERSPVKLFVSATDVKAGRQRVFEGPETTAETVLASACLPHLYKAVEIDGRAYWDGAYLGNPALWPLFYTDAPADVLLITLNPFQRAETPTTAAEIVDRLNEITINGSLVSELRAVAFVQKLIEDGMLTKEAQGRYRLVRTHGILADGWLDDLGTAAKFDTEWSFLQDLRMRGRRAAELWLRDCVDQVGVRSSLDVRARFLDATDGSAHVAGGAAQAV